MDDDQTNKPAATLSDYPYKATIWRNEGEKGPFFNVTFTKTFRDDNGDYRDTNSISSDDLLRVSELARGAHHKVNELRRELPREMVRDYDRNSRTKADDRSSIARDQRRDQRRQRSR